MAKNVEYQLLSDEDDNPQALLMLTSDLGVFYRDSNEWVPLDDEELPFDLESLTAKTVTSDSIARYDSSVSEVKAKDDEEVVLPKAQGTVRASLRAGEYVISAKAIQR